MVDENSRAQNIADRRISVSMTSRDVFNFIFKLICDDENKARLENPVEVLP